MRAMSPIADRSRNEPARVWCIGDWARIDPQTANVHGFAQASEALARRNSVWDAGGETVRLQSVQNEFLSFQIVIESLGEPVEGIFITAQDLDGSTRLNASKHIHLYRESFVPIEDKFYPDELVPLDLGGIVPFSTSDPAEEIVGQRAAVIWVDIYIPERTPIGRYVSTIKVSYHGSLRLAEFTVELDVVDILLPDRLSLDVDLLSYGEEDFARAFPGVLVASSPHREIELAFHRMAHEHRVTYSVLPYAQGGIMLEGYAPSLRGSGERIRVTNWMDWDRRFGPLLDGSAFSDLPRAGIPLRHFVLPFSLEYPCAFRHWGTDRYAAENRAFAEEFIFHIAQRGWTEPSYVVYYSQRERCGFFPWDLDGPGGPEDADVLRSLSTMLRDSLHGHPGIDAGLRIDLSQIRGSQYKHALDYFQRELIGYFDLWNIHHPAWDGSAIQAARTAQSGADVKIWFYLHPCVTPEPSDNIRDLPWLAFRRNSGGICFRNQRCDEYSSERTGPLRPLLYSGAKYGLHGPLPSIRLKTLRRGLQEYELLKMAEEQKGREAASAVAEKAGGSMQPDDWDRQRAGLIELLLLP